MAIDPVVATSASEDAEKQFQGSVVQLEDALATLNIDPQDADEAFHFLKDHPEAHEITRQALAILADETSQKQLLRKIDWAILPCMIVTYFLQFL
jgi:hypothetical protein